MENSQLIKFWLDDPRIFIQNDNYIKFFPQVKMTRIEQLNAITLLCIYTIILILIFYGLSKWLYIPIIVIIFIIILYYIYKNDINAQEKELYRRKGKKYNYNKNNINNLDDIENNQIKVVSGYYDSNNILHLGKEYDINSNKNNNKINYDYDEMTQYKNATCKKPTDNNPFMNIPVTDYNTENMISPCNIENEDIKEQIDNSFYTNLFRDVDDLYDVKNSQRMYYTMPSFPREQKTFANWLYKKKENCKTNQMDCLQVEDIRKFRGY